jgi:hypothetical protein
VEELTEFLSIFTSERKSNTKNQQFPKLDPSLNIITIGRALAQAVSRPASHRGGPEQITGLVMWDFWWTKWHWCRFSLSSPISPADSHSSDFSIFIYHTLIDNPLFQNYL